MTVKMVASPPYVNFKQVLEDETLQEALRQTGCDYDPLNTGVNIDLYGALKRQGLDGVIDTSCGYDYNCSQPTGPPQDPQSKRQISAQPGFMDPPTSNIDAVLVCPETAVLLSSSSSSAGSSSTSSESQSASASGGGGESVSTSTTSAALSQSGCPPISVSVITDLRLTSENLLEQRSRVIYVECADAEGPWTLVTGWQVTDCESNP
jgi:hypothetical protein